MSGTDSAADDRWVGGPQPGESPKERVDRELGELIEETRVVLPGVEILFGFLIILPFQFREELAGFERILYLGAFLAVSVGLALLVASTVEHRIRFRGLDKEAWLFRANRQMLSGIGFVAVGVVLTVYLVLETILGGLPALALAAANGAAIAWLWFASPLLRRRSGARRS
jgi:hypothetical protein